MFKHILFILLFVNTSVVFCQKLPSLSRQQMFADFDTLTKVLMEVSPQGPVREKVTGLNVGVELGKLRTRINQIESTSEFAELVRTAITFCQDGHTSLIWNGYNTTLQEYLEEGISKEAVQFLPLYDSLLRILPVKPFNLGLKYIGGNYYITAPFTYRGQAFHAGMKLLQCNGIDIHKYIQGLAGNVMMRWDFERKRYYAAGFFHGNHLKKQDSLTLTFQQRDGQRVLSTFHMSDTVSYTMRYNTFGSDTFKTVDYFPDEQILYVRVPKMAMENISYYTSMIREKGLGKPIQKVIIDIRNNPGGSDNVWTSILKSLISTPITYKNVLLCNNSATIKSRFLEAGQALKPYPVSFLNNYEYHVYHMGDATLHPDSATIGYRGKIYVIQNENIYSSAGSFTAVAVLAENLVTVGSSTGRLLGRGVNPISFELPHSKILYRVEPVIDFLNVKDAEDIFHDKVEVPVELSIDQYLERISANEMLYSRSYLLKHDLFFKKILSLK
jgi:hypothetical protein